jgi:lipid II isoglutaminyl synthase (glutamine-hydrolysing)
VVEDLEHGLDRALQGDGPLYVIPTYTALLELQELLTRRGQAEAYWR